jgi:hypothetical protein
VDDAFNSKLMDLLCINLVSSSVEFHYKAENDVEVASLMLPSETRPSLNEQKSLRFKAAAIVSLGAYTGLDILNSIFLNLLKKYEGRR